MLGNYLNLPGHKEILEYIMGNTCEDSIEYLNVLMKKKLEESTKIILRYFCIIPVKRKLMKVI